jgi:hypothetical protein
MPASQDLLALVSEELTVSYGGSPSSYHRLGSVRLGQATAESTNANKK